MTLKQCSILVVDDEEVVRDVLTRMLTKQGWMVVTAASGAEALESLRRGPFDLVFLDFRMPGMNCRSVLREMRTSWPGLPIILITGAPEAEVLCQVGDLLPPIVIRKSFASEEVIEAVRRTLCPGSTLQSGCAADPSA